jgi:hypothetical protein
MAQLCHQEGMLHAPSSAGLPQEMLGNLTDEISSDDHHYQRIASPPCMAPEQMDHFDPSANLQKVGLPDPTRQPR